MALTLSSFVSRRLLQWVARIIETLMGGNNKIQDIQQPDKYETDSDNKSDKEGDFEVFYGRTCMTRLGRSVRVHDWIYEAGFILMVIRLNLICNYSKNWLKGSLNSYRLPIFTTSVR